MVSFVSWQYDVHSLHMCILLEGSMVTFRAHAHGRRRAAAYKELLQRQQRQAKLGGLAQRMALQKQLMVR